MNVTAKDRIVVNLGNWIFDGRVDEDGHLTLCVCHEDGSKVERLNADVVGNTDQWGDRFTTETIEKDYLLTSKANH